jgi:hypothetical protein
MIYKKCAMLHVGEGLTYGIFQIFDLDFWLVPYRFSTLTFNLPTSNGISNPEGPICMPLSYIKHIVFIPMLVKHIKLWWICITNLRSHDLTMKIVLNLYISCINFRHWKHIRHIFIRRHEIYVTFVYSYVHILFVNTFIYVLNVLSMYDICM